MDKIINDRRQELTNVKQILKMQDLLNEYDRQNLFLNKQVDTLLKQNIKLKQQKITNSFNVSRVKTETAYDSYHHSRVRQQEPSITKIKNNAPYTDTYKPHLFTQPRKSRYEYLYDEKDLKDLKVNIKNQLKNQTKKNLSTKQVQTTTQDINNLIPSQVYLNKTSQNTPIKKPLQTKKLHQSKSSFIKPSCENPNQSIKEFKIQNINRSKSKQHQGSQKKLQIISKSRIYLEKSTTPLKKIIQQTPQIKPEAKITSFQQRKTTLTKQFYLEKSDILEHSFGYSPHHDLEKKVTLLDSDLPSGLKEQNIINESRMTTKLMPLSIESKQISTNLPKNQERSLFYNEPLIDRNSSQSKRKHSLNPSPKVDFQPTQIFNPKIYPFALKTEEAVPISSIQLNRNSNEQKRKFIKIVSSKKISIESSPKKK